MDLKWNDPRTRKFATTIGLITSNGPIGQNILSVEWTHHISYSPSLISIHLSDKDASLKNISKTKEFGVNLASVDQAWIVSLVGNHSGYAVDKISVLSDLGVSFSKAKNLDVLMLPSAAMQAECNVVFEKKFGDHTMFVGEIVDISHSEKEPLLYHNGKFWSIGEQLPKPDQEFLDRLEASVVKHRRKN